MGTSVCSRFNIILIFTLILNLCFSPDAYGQKTSSRSPTETCPKLIQHIDKTFERVISYQTEKKRAKKLRLALEKSRDKIAAKIRTLCPQDSPCEPKFFARVVINTVYEEIDAIDANNVRVGWLNWVNASVAVVAYVGISTAVQMNMDPLTATMIVAAMTYFVPYILDAVSASVLELVFPGVRRWNYANNNLAQERDLERSTVQNRHRLIHMLQQELISETEANGRSTEAEYILQVLQPLSVCSTTGTDCERAKTKSAEIFAKTLAYINDRYPEIDLRDSDYAEFVQAYFAMWSVETTEKANEFIELVMKAIAERYDVSVRANPRSEQKYRAILHSWFDLHSPTTSTDAEKPVDNKLDGHRAEEQTHDAA